MRTFFFGDIHGNLPALEACLQHMEQCRADRSFCLGDLVGWLPFGNRTLTRMRELSVPTVAGNHDLLAAGLFTDHPAQIDRIQATAYTAGLLAGVPGAWEYLAGLPMVLNEKGLTVCHHSPFRLPVSGTSPDISHFGYLDDDALADALAAWHRYPDRIIVGGHDHVPAVFELPDSKELPTLRQVVVHRPDGHNPLTIKLKTTSRYWVKAGSVGGPYRDGIVAANAVLWDDAAGTVTLQRIPWPVEALRRELIAHRFAMNLPTLRKYAELLLPFEKPA